MREPDQKIEVPPINVQWGDYIEETRHYKLITPLFGGGVESAIADPVTIIRGAGIRGHLRFWWRATRGGKFNGNLADMRREEALIWGGVNIPQPKADKPNEVEYISVPSAVVIQIEPIHDGEFWDKVKVMKRIDGRYQEIEVGLGEPSSPYSYVAFPLRKKKKAKRKREKPEDPKGIWENIEFKLHLRFPKEIHYEQGDISLVEEVNAALWAWETFGGLGARTRRGFGAVNRIDGEVLANKQKFIEIVTGGFEKYVKPKEDAPPDVTILTNTWKVTSVHSDEDGAWKYLFGRLQLFRQDREGGTDDKVGLGKSKWPEASAIRELQITGTTRRKFPRAMLGLPIIFEFKDQPQYNSTLITKEWDRVASPVVFRPHLLQGGQAIGIVGVLGGGYLVPPNLQLQFESGSEPIDVKGELSLRQAKLTPLGDTDDAVEAFLKKIH